MNMATKPHCGPWPIALGALGSSGPTHFKEMLSREMISVMWQLGLNKPYDEKDLDRILE